MKTGQAGRFGWKAQVASLKDFVMSACAASSGWKLPDTIRLTLRSTRTRWPTPASGRENMTKQVNIALAR